MIINTPLLHYPNLVQYLVDLDLVVVPEDILTITNCDDHAKAVFTVAANGAAGRTLELMSEDKQEIIAISSLINIMTCRLSEVTPRFIEMVAMRYACQLVDLELFTVNYIKPEWVNEEAENVPFVGIAINAAYAYNENGVTVGREYVSYDQLSPGQDPTNVYKPRMYKVVIVGKYMAFNQMLPGVSHAIPFAYDDESFGHQYTGGYHCSKTNPSACIDNWAQTVTIDGKILRPTSGGILVD